MAGRFDKFRTRFARYSGLCTLAGIMLVLVFGLRYTRYGEAGQGAGIEAAAQVTVLSVNQGSCVTTTRRLNQQFNIEQKCLEVLVGAEGGASRRLVLLENQVGDLKPGGQVYLVPAGGTQSGYTLVNAHSRIGFWIEQHIDGVVALLGIALIVLSVMVRAPEEDEKDKEQESAQV